MPREHLFTTRVNILCRTEEKKSAADSRFMTDVKKMPEFETQLNILMQLSKKCCCTTASDL